MNVSVHHNDTSLMYNISLFFISLSVNFILLLLFLTFNNHNLLYFIFLLGIAYDMLIFVKIKNIYPLFIITIFIILMDFYLSLYLFFGIKLSSPDYYNYYNEENIFKYILVVNLFKISFYHFLKVPTKYIPIRLKIKKYRSPTLFNILYVTTLLLVLFGFKGTIIYSQTNVYRSYVENLSHVSGLPEYLIIIYIFLWLFETKKYQKLMIIFLFILMIIKLFLLGFRVQMMMYIFLFYILYIDGLVKLMGIILSSTIGYFIFYIYGFIKEYGIEYIFSINLSEINLIGENVENTGFVLSQFSGVITSSLTIIAKLGLENSLISLVGFILNIIIPPRILDLFIPQATIPAFVVNYITHIPGGEYFPIPFYIWFGFLGPILFGIFLAKVINKTLNNYNNNFVFIYFVMIFSTFPRWLFYTQTDYLFRMPIMLATLLGIYGIFRKAFQNRKLGEY